MSTQSTDGTTATPGAAPASAGQRLPSWRRPATLVASTLVTVGWEARKDLTDRRARWGVAAACGALTAGHAALHMRFQRPLEPTSGESAVPRKTPEEVAALRADPEFRARMIRTTALAGGIVLGFEVGRLMLPPALRRRGVRRPHLLTGLTLAGGRLAIVGARMVAEKAHGARRPAERA